MSAPLSRFRRSWPCSPAGPLAGVPGPVFCPREGAIYHLEGDWQIERLDGFLPPMVGVRKRIRGDRGVTAVGALPGMPFDVRGRELHYRAPLRGLVDVVEPDGDGFSGRAYFLGREWGRFRMRRRRG